MESSLLNVGRDIMTSLEHALLNATLRETQLGHPKKIEPDAVAAFSKIRQ